MNILQVVQRTVDHAKELLLMDHIISLRAMADHRLRVMTAIDYAKVWTERARASEDPQEWDKDISCAFALMACAFEPFDMKEALRWAKCEAASQEWRISRDWNRSERSRYEVN